MRHEIDVPIKPTFKEWLEIKPESAYFEVLNEEAQKRGIIHEPGKPIVDGDLYKKP
jgi:hypothetical protein